MITEINGVQYEYLTTHQWRDPIQEDGADGFKVFKRFKKLQITGRVMPFTEYSTLEALEGQAVVLKSTDYESRNEEKIYRWAVLDDVSYNHIALNAEAVIARFTVLV